MGKDSRKESSLVESMDEICLVGMEDKAHERLTL